MKLAFGSFTLDDDRRQLLDGSTPVHLSPKAYELLKLLLVRRPAAISKADIHDQLWTATFVSDVTLASVVSEVRSALGDPASRSRIVRTVHGFGYAFAADAIDAAAPAAVEAAYWVMVGDSRVRLRPGANIVGRDRAVGIWVDSLSVSRHHARIDIGLTDGVATLNDLGSKNGTYLNGTRLGRPTALADGDEIRVGSISLVFRDASAPGTTRTAGH